MSAHGGHVNEAHKVISPLFQTKIGDNFNLVGSQQGRICGFFEKQFFNCMEAYGQKLGRLYCDLESRDFYECNTHEKQRKRYEAMRLERYKQWLEGKRETPFEKDYFKVGQIFPDYYDHTRMSLH